MGWLVSYDTTQKIGDFRAEVLADYTNETQHVVAHSTGQEAIYIALRLTKPTQYDLATYVPAPDGSITVCAVVLITRPNRTQGFGRKDMAETSGPRVSDAAQKVLAKLSPLRPLSEAEKAYVETGEEGEDKINYSLVWATQWRAEVEKYHAARAKAKAIVPGVTIKTSTPLSWRGFNADTFEVLDGTRYKRKVVFRPLGRSDIVALRRDDLHSAEIVA